MLGGSACMSVHRTRVGRVHSELDSNLDACIQETIVHDGRYPTDVRRESRHRAMDPANRAGRSSASARTHTYSTRSTIQSKTDAVQPIGNPNERLGIADASRMCGAVLRVIPKFKEVVHCSFKPLHCLSASVWKQPR